MNTGKCGIWPWTLVVSVGLSALNPVATQAQTGRESVIAPISVNRAGSAQKAAGEKRLTEEKKAGGKGTLGGMGTEEPGVVKDAGVAYDSVFRELSLGVRDPVKVGAGSGTVDASLPIKPNVNLPLVKWRSRPDEAEVKIGQFYLDFHSISASVLASDNINLTTDNRKVGAIAIVGMGVSAMFQVNERLRLEVGGRFAYLPFKNKIGFGDPTQMISGTITPLARAQLIYDIPVSDWELKVFDQFTIVNYGYRRGENFDMFDTDSDAFDRAGRYSYRMPGDPNGTTTRSERLENFVMRNRVGTTASRVLPTVTRFTVGGYHENMWYIGPQNGLPSAYDSVFVALKSERENLRFKPFADYRWNQANNRPGWDQVGYGGVEGPVTENIDFLGEVGYFNPGNSPQNRLLWTARLDHKAGPYTSQSIEYSRRLTDPERSVRTGWMYQLTQIISRDITGKLQLDYSDYLDLDNGNSGGTQYRGAVRADYKMTTRLNVQASVAYRRYDFNDFTLGSSDYYTGRLQFQLKLTDTIDTLLLYQYEQRQASPALDYYENMMLLSVTKRL
jgi:hypothetical protein